MKKIAIYLMVAAAVFFTTCSEEFEKDTAKYEVKAPVDKVELDREELELAINSTATLRATVSPDRALNKTLIWSSSSDIIAVVIDGEITARSAGTATITVTTEDGGKTATCVVTVFDSEATRIRINKNETTLNVGEEEMLTTTFTPGNTSDKSVTWSSSNETVATVTTRGIVAALAPGKATITVKADASGQEHTCEVTVIRLVEEVKLNETTVVNGIDETITIKATVLPADASNKTVKWIITGKGVIIIDKETPGEVTVKRITRGNAEVKAITADGELTAVCKFLDPMLWLAGDGSKIWTWDDKAEKERVWGNGGFRVDKDPEWWGVSIDDIDGQATDTWEGQGKGATMTFIAQGSEFVITKTDKSTVKGIFSFDMSQKTDGVNGEWAMGKLTTSIPILLGGKVTWKEGVDVTIPAYDIMKLNDDEMVLAAPDPAETWDWGHSTFWMFRAQ